MPTREQMDTAATDIRDVISRNYIESDGDQCSCWFQPEGGGPVGSAMFMGATDGTPEPFADLPTTAQVELLTTCVGWQGFRRDERWSVILRVLDGDSPDIWMDSVEVSGPEISQQALEEIEDQIEALKDEPEIHLESTRHYVMPDPEDADSVYDTCDVLGPWDELNSSDRLRALQELNWSSVPPQDMLHIIERELDLLQITDPRQKVWIDAIWRPDHCDRIAPEEQEDKPPAQDRSHNGDDENQAVSGDNERPIRPLTEQLIECCQLDVWPGMATIIDFGLASSSHLGALQYAIREDLVTPQELDAAMGKGEKLTEIAKRGENPYRFVTFRTAWDDMPREPEEHEEEPPDLSSTGQQPVVGRDSAVERASFKELMERNDDSPAIEEPVADHDKGYER